MCDYEWANHETERESKREAKPGEGKKGDEKSEAEHRSGREALANKRSNSSRDSSCVASHNNRDTNSLMT